jgi:hypothetical protein
MTINRYPKSFFEYFICKFKTELFMTPGGESELQLTKDFFTRNLFTANLREQKLSN